MNEQALREMLEDALVGEPPLRPIGHHALRAGVRSRRRHRLGAAGGFALVAGIAIAVPLALHPSRVSQSGHAIAADSEPKLHERPGGLGRRGDLPRQVSFSPDGKTLATADNDGTARFWSVASERQLGNPIKVHGTFIRDVAFSPDGRLLATVDTAGTARFWNVASHRQVGAPINASSEKLVSVAFSPDGKVLVTAGVDGTARLWSVATRRQFGADLRSGSAITQAIFSPDGKLIATSGEDGTVRLWSVATDRQVARLVDRDNRLYAQAVAFSPDGQILVVGAEDLREWSVTTHRQLGQTMHPGVAVTSGVLFTLDGKTIITTEGGSIEEWNATTHLGIGSPITPAGLNGFTAEALRPDGKVLATVESTSPTRLWNLAG